MTQSLVFSKWRRSLMFGLGAMLSLSALAHEYRVGDVRVGHPYATPSLTGASSGAAYIATLENNGIHPDRLLRASTPMAAGVELHTMSGGADGVMRMRMLDEIAVVPAHPIKMRPGQGTHFMLVGLKQPLEEGQRFAMTLEFERAGKVEVKVVVQIPKPRPGDAAAHKH